MFGLSYMRYFCLFLIFFLSACAPIPVKRTPANSISEAEAIANRDDLTPMEQRQLLLSTLNKRKQLCCASEGNVNAHNIM